MTDVEPSEERVDVAFEERNEEVAKAVELEDPRVEVEFEKPKEEVG